MIDGTDLKLEPLTERLVLVNGDLTLVNGNAAIVQHIKQRLRLFLGEFFLDVSVGIPYFQFIFVKNPNFALVETLLRDTVLGTPGVLTLESFNFSFNNTNRELEVFLTGNSINGTINFSEILEVA